MNDGLKDWHRQTLVRVLSSWPGLERALLFGSRAMGTFTTTSDIDIALVGARLTLRDLARLSEALEQSNIPQRVDLLLHHSIDSEALRAHIAQYGVDLLR